MGKRNEILNNILLHVRVKDRWSWHLASNKCYIVSDVYHMSDAIEPTARAETNDIIWNKTILLKVPSFFLRLLRNQIPTKDNLVRQEIIQPTSNTCMSGCGMVECIGCMFLGCDFFGCIWFLARQWL